MKLTWEEIKEITNRLEEVVANSFHSVIMDVMVERMANENDGDIEDEDILQIKEQLKRIL
tara:strand:- start:1293 stop:1472 length:180 start_codon:yes stop_codon:yes gene_type:complete